MFTQVREELSAQLEEIRSEGLFKSERVIVTPQQATVKVSGGEEVLNLCANNYLGLADDPRVVAAAKEALDRWGYGMASVRFICGTQEIHKNLERRLSGFLGTEDSILYSSCFDANGGLFETLLGKDDAVISDELNHASIIDGIRLCAAQRYRYHNRDMAHLDEQLREASGARRRLIATDGVFSMEGDICILPELIAIKKEFGCCLLVDEAHALGVIGPGGRGTDEHFGVSAGEVDIWTGSLAKGIPSNGGFVAASQELCIYLQHAAAPFIFSAALCPAAVGTVRASLAILRSEPERMERLHRNARLLREGLRELGYNTGASQTAVIPVLLGDEATTALFAARMRELGVMVTPVMFPAVAQGIARLRLCVTAAHSVADLEFALENFRRLRDTVGPG